MQPFDLLTNEDKELIEEYCINYAQVCPESLEKTLYQWNKNKKKLCKAFGNQLRISVPIEVDEKTKQEELYQRLETKLPHLSPWQTSSTHPFYQTILDYQVKFTEKIPDTYYWARFISLFRVENFNTGKIVSADYVFRRKKDDKELKFQKGTKTMRAIRRTLEFYDFPQDIMKKFEKWRDEVSVIVTTKGLNNSMNLVFSIHPIDFMSMSDNKCGWSSCMSWESNGSYSTGTIEMMNSNVAFVAYIESQNQKFILNNKTIPNKSWRTLVFAHPKLLVIGKQYPYQNPIVAKKILEKIMPILEKNVGWTYQYKFQKYLDMKHSYSNEYIKYDLSRNYDGKKHKIFTYMNVMYADMIMDHKTEYLCCRNYVKHNLYLNLSGPATCLRCGEKLDPDNSNDISSNRKYCMDCYNLYGCQDCGNVDSTDKRYKVKVYEYNYGWRYCSKLVCEQCLTNEYHYSEARKCFVLNDDMQYFNMTYKDEKFRPVSKGVIEKYAIGNSLFRVSA